MEPNTTSEHKSTETVGRRIYVASSWRNPIQPTVVALLREFGHEVYDFRNPTPENTGFGWRQCGDFDAYTIPGYLQALQSKRALEGYMLDKNALDWADTCVLVLPCGRSAHLEAGYAAGQGKEVYFLLHETGFEPELMYLLGTRCATDVMQIIEWMQPKLKPQRGFLGSTPWGDIDDSP